MTTTMLETYDTQMLDYPTDLDVQMHGSSEAWMVEAVMEEDIHRMHSPKALDTENASHSVEVDMDAEEGVEYEMLDGVEQYEELPQDELVDVEVYDASDALAEIVTQADPSFIPTETSHTVSFSSIIESPNPEVDFHPPDLSGAPHSPAPESVEPSFSDTRLATVENPGHEEAPYFVEDSTPIETLPPISGVSNPEPELDHTRVADGQSVTDSADTEPTEFALTTEEQEKPRDEGERDDAVEPLAIQTELYDQAPDNSEELPSMQIRRSQTGVYIDPPPAVILSFPDTDYPDVYLFNHPSASGSATPTDTNPNEPPALELMLHNQPTLYYEPVTSVFEALRLESQIGAVMDLNEGELAIEAYELHLMVAEDNIYAREVSLHDLNVLHDGSDIPGPLRLRLRSVAPRFIVRYHQLQDHVARLHITDPGLPTENPLEEYLEPPVLDGDMSRSQTDEEKPIPGEASHTDSNEETSRSHPDEHENEAALQDASNTENEPDSANQNDQLAEDVDSTHGPHSTSQQSETDPEAESSETAEPELETASENPGYEEPDNGQDNEEYGERLLQESDSLEDYPYHESPAVHNEEIADAGATPHLDTSPLLPTDVLENIGNENLTNDEGLEDTSDQNEINHNDHDESPAYDVEPDIPSATPEVVHVGDTTELVGEVFESNLNTEGENEEWDDDLDGEGDPDTTWEAENETTSNSNQSSVTLSSTTSSKRSIADVEPDDEDNGSPLSSPGPKRPRVE
ncbi:hypothetical protein BD779DRAFT_1500989 [Infundibulicybe gibba]|nr:hypothetical protein BD779DRAFT_1500989 [Infundibulicybe gibba]